MSCVGKDDMNGNTAIHKILKGVLEYRKNVRPTMLKQLQRIKNNPQPKAVYFTCMDSRMMATRFTQAEAGDMFMVRNAGNLIPRANLYGQIGSDVSVTTEPAAIELACVRGGIRHVVVCGHSDCKAMNTLYGLHENPKTFDKSSPLDNWLLKNGALTWEKFQARLDNPNKPLVFISHVEDYRFSAYIDEQNQLDVKDQLSQINCLQQLENIVTHSTIREHVEKDLLTLNAMWFDVYTGNVYFFNRPRKRFILLDEDSVNSLASEL